jgi:uncharacterized membrane protein HdeD (DUF308 family)
MAEPSERPSIIPGEDVNRRYALEERGMTLEAGVLGRFFGSASRAPTSIAGIIALLLTFACILSLFVTTNIPSAELWKLVLPVITAILGYLFGKSTSG